MAARRDRSSAPGLSRWHLTCYKRIVRHAEDKGHERRQELRSINTGVRVGDLGRRAFAAGRTVEIVIYGGSALLLTLNRQINTGDVDAVFEGNKDFVKRLAAEMAENSDIDDIKLLARAIGLKNSQDALALVEKFHPRNMLQPKTRLGLEEIFSNLDIGPDQDAPPS
jgi:hypothetical protein